MINVQMGENLWKYRKQIWRWAHVVMSITKNCAYYLALRISQEHFAKGGLYYSQLLFMNAENELFSKSMSDREEITGAWELKIRFKVAP